MKKIISVIVKIIVVVICSVCLYGSAKVNAEEKEMLPEIYIRAINPGYTIDGKSNVGELIEIARKNSDAPVLLAGLTVRYTTSSGSNSILFEFPENSYMTGESLLLRLASSPESELASINYTKTLAMKASLALLRGEEVVDELCWTGKDGCYKEFVSARPTFLVRNIETNEFEHVAEYEVHYDENAYRVEGGEQEEGFGALPGHCQKLEFSEILSYYETQKTEQFVEIHNYGTEQVLLDGCRIRYKNKEYVLEGIVRPEEYHVYYPNGFTLTKNPTNTNTLEIVDVNGEVIDKMIYPNGQRKGTAFAWIGYDENGRKLWKVTYAPTPGAPNNYQEYKTCEAGKVINEVTGNCVKITTVTEKICPEGQYLNLLTGRCRKTQEAEEKKCKEGYYLNPETGRCRKITENKGADYSIEPEAFEEKSSFVGLYAVIAVVIIGVLYLVYEFRFQIGRLWRKVRRR